LTRCLALAAASLLLGGPAHAAGAPAAVSLRVININVW
jgi:hypothetical protein